MAPGSSRVRVGEQQPAGGTATLNQGQVALGVDVVVALDFSFLDAAGSGDDIAGFKRDEFDALSGATGFADERGFGADDLAVAGDDDDVGIILDLEHVDDGAGALVDLHIDDALTGTGLEAVVTGGGALAHAVFSDGKDQAILGDDLHGDDGVVGGEAHRIDAGGGAAHGAHVAFGKLDGHAVAGGDEDQVRAGAELGRDELVVIRLEADGDDAARERVVELGELALFDDSELGGHDDELIGRELPNGQEGLDGLVFLERDELADVLALTGRTGVGNVIDLQPIEAALVCEDEQVGVGRSAEKVLDDVLAAGGHAPAALAAAGLAAIGVERGAPGAGAAGVGGSGE